MIMSEETVAPQMERVTVGQDYAAKLPPKPAVCQKDSQKVAAGAVARKAKQENWLSSELLRPQSMGKLQSYYKQPTPCPQSRKAVAAMLRVTNSTAKYQ